MTLNVNVLSPEFRDKVLGCWIGKNCGGTLGAPLEKTYGEPEPYDVWWYPEIREGGIPNDDLEMQLIWLKAIEEIGLGVKAADLAQYWLDHIGYNWDEYGLSKTNLRLGLVPPVSGNYNNWFVDCMGCPIRSEIWACIAPGLPNLAVKYAYEDAICDHAGGESVFGEIYNTAIESAAFVVSDIHKLLSIGRSYVPDASATARAIDAVTEAYMQGLDWKGARQRVLAATPHYNAQYSPINIGFQVIGLLYGEHFGDAICKTVNCGYDTDCTGATVGSILGIIAGASELPEKWTEPLGRVISTNESWGGLRNASTGSCPVPMTIDELTSRTIEVAAHTATTHETWVGELYADANVCSILERRPLHVPLSQGSVAVIVDYVDSPAVAPHQMKVIGTQFRNPHADEMAASVTLRFPTAWKIKPISREVTVPGNGSVALTWEFEIPGPSAIQNRNNLFLDVVVANRPSQPSAQIVLIGAKALRVQTCDAPDADSNEDLLAKVFEPEVRNRAVTNPMARAGHWCLCNAMDNALPVENTPSGRSVIYVQSFLWSDVARDVFIGVPATRPTKFWVNQEEMLVCPEPRRLRPNYDGDGSSYKDACLKAGWNEILIKYVSYPDVTPFEAHLTLAHGKDHHSGLTETLWTRLPWD
jgi:hypothetical protein